MKKGSELRSPQRTEEKWKDGSQVQTKSHRQEAKDVACPEKRKTKAKRATPDARSHDSSPFNDYTGLIAQPNR